MFKIYSSSAGSGKTYTLTKEYIKLALHPANDSYYRHILAVTFTNAAAQEMKERIMGTLRLFASGKEHPMLFDIVSEIFPETQTSPGLIPDRLQYLRERSSRIFTRILHGYSDFSVMTIDSFMSRLIGSFTDELGLPFGFETRLDSDLLTEAIDRILSRIGISGEETLSSLLENYYLEHAKEEGAWGALPSKMLSAAGDLLNEESYLAMSQVSDLSLTDWQEIRKQLNQVIRLKEEEIRENAEQALKIITNNGLVAGDFFYSSRGIFGFFQGRSQRKSPKVWEAPNSYVIKTIEEDKWTGSKISTSAEVAIEGISPSLTDLFFKIEEIRVSYAGVVSLYKSLVSQIYNLSLLNEIKREFDQLLRQNNQVHISEFNRKVIDIVAGDPVPFIFERLGEKYNHILIDEFQDTSKLQFANLLPLIENALANGYFNLIVGDVKQAIYRFRGGDMELLLKLTGNQAGEIAAILENNDPFITDRLFQIAQNTNIARLVTNRRSFQEITVFNNSFFQHLSESEDTGTLLTKEVYDENFRQETGSSAPIGGHVEIEFFKKEEEEPNLEDNTPETDAVTASEEPIDLQVKKVLSLIAQLRKEGYDWRDIAILCRYKKDSARLAASLQTAQIPLISDDSLLLSNSFYVAIIVNFIRVIHHPAHMNHRLETALLIHRVMGGKPLDGTAMAGIVGMSKEPRLTSFLSWLAEINIHFDISEIYQIGIYELCEQIIARLNLAESKIENQYVFRFLDEVLKFESSRVSHHGDFLNWWDTTGNSLSITAPSETDAIRITTIHKSKGLEYPVVLFPYADWKVTPKPGSRLWVDLTELSETDANLSYEGKLLRSAAVPLTKKLEETPVGDQYKQEVDRVLLENINLVYVALTRPVQRLYILATFPTLPKDGGMPPGAAVNAWLYSFLVARGEWKEGQLRYTLAASTTPPNHAHNKRSDLPFLVATAKGNREATTLSLKKNADKAFYTETFEKERDFGQKIKQMLIQIQPGSSVEELVTRNTRSGLFRPSEAPMAIEKIKSILSQSALKHLFSDETKKISNQIIRRGGEVSEVDRIVKTKDGTYHFIHFSPISVSSRKRLSYLLQLGTETGLRNLKGYLFDIDSGEMDVFD